MGKIIIKFKRNFHVEVVVCVCVPGTIVFVPGGSLEVSFIKSTSRWEMRGSCGWRWWVVLIPRDYPEFGFDGDGSSDLCFFRKSSFFEI